MLDRECERQFELELAARARRYRHSLRDLDNWDGEEWAGSDGMTIEDYLGHYPGDA